MRFVIVGASGFVGRHLLQCGRGDGHEMIGTQASACCPDLIRFDLRQDRLWDCLPRLGRRDRIPTYGVVCGGITQIDRCIRERDLSYLVNVTKTIDLLRDFAAGQITPVFISTGFVFDGATGGYAEGSPTGPVNEYGRQRLEVEQFLLREVPCALILRLDKVIGDDPGEAHLFSEWYQAVETGQTIRCIEGQVFAPTLVDDVARAIVLGCRLGLRGVYHVANPERRSRMELAQEFLQALGRETPVEAQAQDRLGFLEPRPLRTYLDVSKFQAATRMQFTTIDRMIQCFVSRVHQTLRVS